MLKRVPSSIDASRDAQLGSKRWMTVSTMMHTPAEEHVPKSDGATGCAYVNLRMTTCANE